MATLYSRSLLLASLPVGTSAVVSAGPNLTWVLRQVTCLQAAATGSLILVRSNTSGLPVLINLVAPASSWSEWQGRLVLPPGTGFYIDVRVNTAVVSVSGYELTA